MAGSGSNQSPEQDPISISRFQHENPETRQRRILVAEDNESDLFLICEAIRNTGINDEVHVVRDGHEAMEFLDAVDNDISAPCPDVLLLDLNLPRRSGDEVLAHLRASLRCRDVPVLVVTSSDSDRDRESARVLGASSYFRKPSDYDEFMKLGPLVRALLAVHQSDPPFALNE